MTKFALHRRGSLVADASGATLMEFTLVAPVLLLMLLGFIDFAHWMYVRSVAIGALEGVARGAGVGGAKVDPATYEQAVEAQIHRIAKDATFTWSKKSYYQFSGINKPEKLVSDVNKNGVYDPGDCWEDLNPNGIYDINPGRTGIGGPDDIVYYQLTVSFTPLIPIGGFLPLLSGNHSSTVSTIVRRQPYAAQVPPAIRC
jgi:hypothetical protein